MLSFVSSTAIVDGTLWTLIAFSAVTWTLILAKALQQVRLTAANRQYKKRFWGATDLQAASKIEDYTAPTSRLALAGFNALADADASNDSGSRDLEHSGDRQELLERYLRQQIVKERRSIEAGLAVLASIGSTAPFVGLFGTVWGIMHALTSISKSGSASLDVVAGPIGEALIATGVGIAVAVPAVLAYNFFLRRLKVTGADLDDFATDFINLAQKTSFRIKRPVVRETSKSVSILDWRKVAI
jgi:biopolymer transport protein ExbB